jgi:hypothetical protein
MDPSVNMDTLNLIYLERINLVWGGDLITTYSSSRMILFK